MTGNGSLDGSLRGVGVTNLTDHDDIRVKTEHGTEAFGEGAAVVGVDRNLRDASDAVFNGVF